MIAALGQCISTLAHLIVYDCCLQWSKGNRVQIHGWRDTACLKFRWEVLSTGSNDLKPTREALKFRENTPLGLLTSVLRTKFLGVPTLYLGIFRFLLPVQSVCPTDYKNKLCNAVLQGNCMLEMTLVFCNWFIHQVCRWMSLVTIVASFSPLDDFLALGSWKRPCQNSGILLWPRSWYQHSRW